jgi:hypothetical protein
MNRKKPKVLFLHQNFPDYLAVGLFHGLRKVLWANCVDVPRFDCCYSPMTDLMREKCAGHGFSIFGLLDEIKELESERFMWYSNVESYDLVVLLIDADWPLYGQSELLNALIKKLKSKQLVILDNHDISVAYPFAWRLIKREFLAIRHWRLKNLYFKRELIGNGENYNLGKLPLIIRKLIPLPSNYRPISFSIPAEKITRVTLDMKEKQFCSGAIDPEMATDGKTTVFNELGSKNWNFKNEDEYYNDIQKSRFGITTKRAGWDCLRHYEYAANGAVLCFKDLNKKPSTCAPHGLSDQNSIIYKDAKDLNDKIVKMTDGEYKKLLNNSYRWIESKTTENIAKQFLLNCGIKTE